MNPRINYNVYKLSEYIYIFYFLVDFRNYTLTIVGIVI
jgi:hypothetical protein